MRRFAQQTLRNRSFRGQDLNGADFHNADIRGCDFSKAQLVGANFSGAKLGLSKRQKVLLAIFIGFVFVSVFDLISRFVFNTIPQNPFALDAAYIQVLVGCLSAASLTSVISACRRTTKMGQLMLILTGILGGALLGFAIAFFYPSLLDHYITRTALYFSDPSLEQLAKVAEFWRKNRIMLAQQGAIAGAILLLLLSRVYHRSYYRIAVSMVGAIASYGATFIWGAFAGVYLSVQEFNWGAPLSLVVLLYLWFTTISLLRAVDECRAAIGTSFRGADLTHAKFDGATLSNADFSKAIGHFPRN